ncbi:MAG: hypothetical protein AAB407_01095 [Patescibacteria group bacterium]
MGYESALYIGEQVISRIKAFVRHWYYDSFFALLTYTTEVLTLLDKKLALRVTLRNFFQPLYQDHTPIGHTLGIVFRSFRVALAGLLYAGIALTVAMIYVAWAGIPIVIILSGI